MELTRHMLDRIDTVDKDLHSYRTSLPTERSNRLVVPKRKLLAESTGALAWRPYCGQRPRLHSGNPNFLWLHVHGGLAARL